MLKGFGVPLSPDGVAGTVPRPPWHYVGRYYVVEFWADLPRVAELLPPGASHAEDAGKCLALFSDCQYATEGGQELREPSVSQYQEFMLAVLATYEGKPAAFCPYIFVDNDNALLRGHIQGMPKQLGSVRMTRPYDVACKAASMLAPGGVFAATLAHRDRRLAEAAITLTATTNVAPNRQLARFLNVRHFPNLAAGGHEKPAVHELVRQKTRDVVMSPVWTGEATLAFHPSPWHELAALSPVRVGPGYVYTMAMTIDDLTTLQDLRTA